MARRRRRSGIVDFFDGFNAGYGATSKVINDIEDGQVRRDIRQAEGDYTPRNTEAVSGQDALTAGRQAYDAALANATTEEQRAQIEQQFTPTLRALEADATRPASVIRSLGVGSAFQQRDGGEFSPQEVEGAKAQAKARIYSAAGREEDAARVLNNATRNRAIADQDEIRAAVAGLRPGESTRNEALRSSIGTGADITGASSIPTHTDAPAAAQVTTSPQAQARQGVRQVRGFRDPLEHYYSETAPKVLQTMVRQGQLEQAERYASFIESQQGKRYLTAYSNGIKKFAIGDYESALKDFEGIYNDERLYPDGKSVKLSPLDDGKIRIDQYDADGKLLGSRTGKLVDMTEQAALALNPVKTVEFMMTQKAKREGEAALLDRQMKLEEMRQQGRETAEDRRDARLVRTLEARERTTANRPAGGLTAAQQRSNQEILAARERIAGMTPDEIRQRTTKATDSGRDNPLYDGTLARSVTLAGRRLIGDDPDFDNRQSSAPASAPSFDMDDLRKRFRADGAMNNYSLGEFVPGKGVKVMQKGRHIGFYN